MPQYLPVQAINRSQRVRIGGKTLLPGVTAYVDMGYLAVPYAAPTFVGVANGKKAEGNGLKKSVWFAYAVTAVDASGGETPVGPLSAVKSEGGAETESNLNFEKLSWVAVPNATSYNIYRAGKGDTGFSTQAAAEAGTLGLIGNSKTASFTDNGNTNAVGVAPPVNNTSFFNTSTTPWSPRKELQNHLAIGAVIVVGSLSNSNSDWLLSAGGELSGIETKLKFTLKEATWRQRSTGRVVTTATTQTTITAAAAGKFYGFYAVFNGQSGKLETVIGAEVAEAKLVVYPTLKSFQIPYAQGLTNETEIQVANPPTAIAPGLVDLRGALRA